MSRVPDEHLDEQHRSPRDTRYVYWVEPGCVGDRMCCCSISEAIEARRPIYEQANMEFDPHQALDDFLTVNYAWLGPPLPALVEYCSELFTRRDGAPN